MSGIRGKDTKPEIMVRKALFSRNFRYKLHKKDLPGKPDLAFPRYNAVIQINGCFWHGHDCHLFKWPSSRKEFWKEKITHNRQRDKENLAALHNCGYRVLTIHECALKGKTRLDFDELIDEVENWLLSTNMENSIQGKPVS